MNEPFDSQAFLKQVSTQPGVYQMLGEDKTVLYVGKAKNLKKRLSSYFQKKQDSRKTQLLLEKIHSIQVTITHTEVEALLLENSLIKQHRPKFNVVFRDDKSYPYLFISTEEAYPRLAFHRGPKKEKGAYFGPYPNAYAVRENLQMLQKIFKLRNCNNHFFSNRSRPCLQYQIKRCTAPCVEYISKEDYAKDVSHAIAFLEGKTQEILNKLRNNMEQASVVMDYEQAAKFRNQMMSLRKLQAQQSVIDTPDDEMDIVAFFFEQGVYAYQVLMIRSGRVIGHKTYFPLVPSDMDHEEALLSFLTQYYLNDVDRIPKHLILNLRLKDKKTLAEVLLKKSGQRVDIRDQVKGSRARLLAMAFENAKQAIQMYLSDKTTQHQRFMDLQMALKLLDRPKKIACFDISHTLGEETVASYVVFNQDGPLKAEYRKLRIQGVTPGDDYGAMKLAIHRRFETLLPEHRPDILLIDGGKGQLHQAECVMEDLNIQGVLLIGVAKGKARKSGQETLWLSGETSPFLLDPSSPAFHLIQQVRDEAHRFAIAGHRARRDKKRKTSGLESIPGIGPKRRKALLNHFGGWQEIKNASIEALERVPGMSRSLAEKVYNECH